MNSRLQQFLAAENITQAQLADTLGVARASVSHILAGRNRPGFEFIENLSRHYPAINLEWFITGKGKMYKSTDVSTIVPEKQQDTVIDETTEQSSELLFDFDDTPKSDEAGVPKNMRKVESNSSRKRSEASNNKKFITKVLLFYSDGSFEEYGRQ